MERQEPRQGSRAAGYIVGGVALVAACLWLPVLAAVPMLPVVVGAVVTAGVCATLAYLARDRRDGDGVR